LQELAIPLHYSEFGLGGGLTAEGTTPATTAMEAARKPFFGVYPKQYTETLDPWRTPEVSSFPWPQVTSCVLLWLTHQAYDAVPACVQVRQFMISFWQKAISWLAQGGGPTYHITKCFQWTLGSYDVLAIYPESTNILDPTRTYYVAEVSQAMLAHNTVTAAFNQAAALLNGTAVQNGTGV
jgi:hypothetical protein